MLGMHTGLSRILYEIERGAHRVELVLCGVELLAGLNEDGRDAECDSGKQHRKRLPGCEDCTDTNRLSIGSIHLDVP